MNNNWLLVSAFIVGTFVIWILFDVWLGANAGPTESQVIKTWAKRSTFFPWLLGFLCGHWFFGIRSPMYTAWVYGVGVMAALISWDIWWWKIRIQSKPVYPAFRWPGWWLLIGIPCGMFLFGQGNVDSPF